MGETMEIGGYDLIYTSILKLAWHVLVDICRTEWRELVVEFDPEPGHFYVYKDMNAANGWFTRAACVDEQMIYFIIEGNGFTAVVDDPKHADVEGIVARFNKIFDKVTK
jgi:hypothetical protein